MVVVLVALVQLNDCAGCDCDKDEGLEVCTEEGCACDEAGGGGGGGGCGCWKLYGDMLEVAADISRPPLNWPGSAVDEYMTELVAPGTKRFFSASTDSFWSDTLDQDGGKSVAKAMHLVVVVVVDTDGDKDC